MGLSSLPRQEDCGFEARCTTGEIPLSKLVSGKFMKLITQPIRVERPTQVASVSKLMTFRRCPAKWLKRVEKVSYTPPSSFSEYLGLAVHSCLAEKPENRARVLKSQLRSAESVLGTQEALNLEQACTDMLVWATEELSSRHFRNIECEHIVQRLHEPSGLIIQSQLDGYCSEAPFAYRPGNNFTRLIIPAVIE